jgi:hypothetical protein
MENSQTIVYSKTSVGAQHFTILAMSVAFSIERPSVIATLPRPIDHLTGRYVVSDVHGGTPGSRKRKRAELVVGTDGEGLNIYDVRC